MQGHPLSDKPINMNNRDLRQFNEGSFYHIYNRGNGKENIFLDDNDFRFFMLRLKQNLFPDDKSKERLSPLPENSFSLISYCLMPNHFHLLLKQNKNIPTSKLLLKVCTSYSMYFNKKYEHVGHVFQDCYKQILIDDDLYLRWLTCYIHQNPKVAGLVTDLNKYPWSSYGEFLDNRNGLCDKEIILEQFKNNKEFQQFTETSYKIIKAKKDIAGVFID